MSGSTGRSKRASPVKSEPVVKPGKPEPGEGEKRRIAAAAARLGKRERPVEVTFDKGVGGPDLAPTHADNAGWSARLLDTLGTQSVAFLSTHVNALDYSNRDRGGERGESALALNAGLALVGAIRLEAALAVQMASVHSLTCELLGRAKLIRRAIVRSSPPRRL